MAEAAPKAVRRTTVVAVSVVAMVAGVVSYMHMHELAERAGEGWRAWLVPLAVDGLMVAASMAMLARRRAGRSAGVLAWSSLLAGIAASLAANVAAAEPTLVGRAVAAWPPVALLLAYELLMDQVRIHAPAAVAQPAVEAASPLPADCRDVADPTGAVPTRTTTSAGDVSAWRQGGEPVSTTLVPLIGLRDAGHLDIAAVMPSDDDPDAARQAARQHYREVLTAGGSITGKELAARYRKSERWGRDQIRAVRDELALTGVR